MTLALRHPDARVDCGIDPPYVAIQIAATLMGLAERTLRLKCQEEWESAGLAKKFPAGWGILPAADSRLRAEKDCIADDLQAIAQLWAQRVRPRYIEIAEAKRDILIGFDRFRMLHRNEVMRDVRRIYIGVLQSEKQIGKGATIKKLSVTRLYEWSADYEKGGLSALVPQYNRAAGKTDSIGEAAWADFLNRMGTGNQPRLRDCWRLTGAVAEHHGDQPAWSWPKYSTVRLRYKKIIHPIVRAEPTIGPNKSEGKYLPKITRSYENIASGQIMVGDERTVDYFVRVPGANAWRLVRPKLTAWIDARSRYLVGWKLDESANSDTILDAFVMGCITTGTLPDEILVDNGEDYRSVAGRSRKTRSWDEFDSNRIFGAFERLKIIRHFARARHPWAKGLIEGRFNTMKDRHDRFQPTFCGGTHDERPHDLQRRLEADILSVPTIEEARDQFAAFLEALHDERVNGDGMGGLSPRQALRQYFTDSPRIIPEETLKLMCCRMHGPIKVSKNGVRAHNIYYGRWQEEVFALQGREVYYLEDPVEASFITICDQIGVGIVRAYADNNLGETRQEIRAAENFRKSAKRRAKRVRQDGLVALQSTPELVTELRAKAARCNQIPDADLPAPPTPQTLRVVRADAEVGVEQIKRAVGGEAIKRLKELNAGAAALNRKQPRRPSFRDLSCDEEPAVAAPQFTASLRDLEDPNES